MNDIKKAKQILEQNNQDHIINLLDKLEEKEKNELSKQILNIDFHQIMELYDNTKKEIEIKENVIEPITYLDKEKLSDEQKEKFNNIGKEVLKNRQYAVVTMAGRTRE